LRQVSTELDDETLVAHVAGADRGAYAVLVQRHGLRYRALAQRMVGDLALAEDLVQEAFVKLWTHADRVDPGKAKFTTWFHRIVVNRCLNEKRKRTIEPLPEGFDQPDESETAEDALVAAGDNAVLMAAVHALPDRQRTAITLSYLDGLSNMEAAEVMDLKLKAFESLLVRARGKLRDQLAGAKSRLLSALG
jgi:RNA polymerase sigma-70 factor (ECF subfamily)